MSFRNLSRLLFAAALCTGLSAPAFAQRASLGERVAALEAQAAGNRGNVDLLNQITALKAEVQALRAQIEQLQHQAEQDTQADRAKYLDLDGRLNRLEGGTAAPGAAANVSTRVPAATQPPSRTPTATVADTAIAESAPTVHGDPGALAKGASERDDYARAFDALKAGRYAESAQLFQRFLQDYPGGTYAPNALYWLGESYYVTQNYALAQHQFQTLFERYPTHDKAPGALLKVGLAQYGLQQFEAAAATLGEVAARFPGTDAARTAEDRLRAIELNRLR